MPQKGKGSKQREKKKTRPIDEVNANRKAEKLLRLINPIPALRVEDTPQIFARVSPFSLMRRFSEEMDRLFPDVGFGGLASGFGREFGRLADLEGSMWLPPVEAFEREDKLIVRADLPGLTKDDINVDITDDAGHRRHLSP